MPLGSGTASPPGVKPSMPIDSSCSKVAASMES
jgi:hypothetical protein